MSAYTLAPREPNKEFLITVIEPMPNNLSEQLHSHLGPVLGCRLMKLSALDATGQLLRLKRVG